jgi:hypothetical protein
MANFVYNQGKFLLANGSLNLLSDTIQLLLVANTYEASNTVANLADANNVHELISHVITTGTVSGYANVALTSRTVSETDDGGTTNGFAFFNAANVTFSTLGTGNTIGGCILYRAGANNNASPLIAFYDVVDTPTNGGDITIQWANTVNGGVLKLA